MARGQGAVFRNSQSLRGAIYFLFQDVADMQKDNMGRNTGIFVTLGRVGKFKRLETKKMYFGFGDTSCW